MQLKEYLEMCRAKHWDELIDFLSSNIKDMSYKVLVSAVIEVYHPDQKKAQQYGLNVWNDLLSSNPLSQMFSLFTSAVSLIDLVNAYSVASAENMLNDKKIAQILSDYIEKNKEKLAHFLDSDQIPEITKSKIRLLFPNLSITKKQNEDYFKSQYAAQAEAKIAFIQSRDTVCDLLASVFSIAAYEFHFLMSEPDNFLGIKSSGEREGSISFRKSISSKYVRQFTEVLSAMGLSVNYVNFTNQSGQQRGIQLFSSLQTIKETLTKYSDFCTQAEENQPLVHAVELLKNLQELKFKVETDLSEAEGLSCQ